MSERTERESEQLTTAAEEPTSAAYLRIDLGPVDESVFRPGISGSPVVAAFGPTSVAVGRTVTWTPVEVSGEAPSPVEKDAAYYDEVRQAVGRGAPTLLLGTSTRSLKRGFAQLVAARGKPGHNQLEFAASLGKFGAMFSEQGLSAEALPIAEESVVTFRNLAQGNPDRYLPGLAKNLNNLGVTYTEQGRSADALALAEESVATFRNLAQDNPARYVPDLAQSLNNLGVTYTEQGRLHEALAVTEESVATFRNLAQDNPDRYLPGLAQSRNNLGVAHSALGRSRESEQVRTTAGRTKQDS